MIYSGSDPVPHGWLARLVLVGAVSTVLNFVAGAAVVDVVFPAMIGGSWPTLASSPLLLVGALGGQFGLLAIWGVFGSDHWAVRLPRVLLLATWLYASFLLGLAVAEPSWVSVFEALLYVPLVFAAVQLPLWSARMALGWRLEFPSDARRAERFRAGQFGVQHLLGATAFVAVVLGLTQTAVLLSARPGSGPAETWISLLIVFGVASGLGFTAALPCLWAAFVQRKRGLAAGVIAGHTIALAILVPIVIVLLDGGRVDPLLFGISFWLHAGAMGVMYAGLSAVRACGYTMVRRGRNR